MNYEVEINKINARLDNLQQSFIQAQKNQVPITAKTDSTANKVNVLTPYTESKTVYIDDEYVTFDIAKDGIISVQMVDNDGQNVPCMFERMANEQIRVSFAKRDSLATVTISIQ